MTSSQQCWTTSDQHSSTNGELVQQQIALHSISYLLAQPPLNAPALATVAGKQTRQAAGFTRDACTLCILHANPLHLHLVTYCSELFLNTCSCRYADAVLEAVQQLGQLLAGQQPDPSTVDAEDGLGIFMFFCATVAAVLGWSWYSSRKQNARYKVSKQCIVSQSMMQQLPGRVPLSASRQQARRYSDSFMS